MTEAEAYKARAEHAEGHLRSLSLSLATLRSCAKTLLSQCDCGGLGKLRKQRGFFTTEVECVKCIPIREALATGEIV